MVYRMSKVTRVFILICLCILTLTVIFPIVFMVANSFKDQAEYIISPLSIPKSFNLSNYYIMFKSYNILKLLANSLIIIITTIIIEVFLSSLAAYAFAKKNFKFKNILFFFFISMLIVPFPILMLPLFNLFGNLNLINTKFSMILTYTGVVIPFALFFLTVNFRTIPEEIIESAKIDGASYWRIYWNLILPIGKSAIVTLVILDSTWLWGDVVLGLVLLTSNETRTLTAGIAAILSGHAMRNIPLLMTGLFLSSLPIFILYSLVAKFIMKESIAGALKG